MPTGAHGTPYKPSLQNNSLRKTKPLLPAKLINTKNQPPATNLHYIPEPVGCVIRTDSFFRCKRHAKSLAVSY